MRVIDAVRRSAVGIGPERTIAHAAEIIEQAGVGALAVIDEGHIIDLVTDRDLVRRGLARRFSADAPVDGVMTTDVMTVQVDADLHDVFAIFRTDGIRRLPVTRGEKSVGMITIDDLVIDLAADLSDLVRLITGDVLFADRDVPAPVTTA
jgi:CBS domain-containing protein